MTLPDGFTEARLAEIRSGLSPRSRALALMSPDERKAAWRRKYGHIHTDERKTFVYFLYAPDGACLYVGRSVNPESRWRAHIADVNKPWTDDVSLFRKWGPYDHKSACRIEREQIELYQPAGNVQFTKRGAKA